MLQTSTLSDTNIARNSNVVFKLTSLNDFSLEEGPVSQAGEFQQILDSFYDTDSPLSVTNIEEMAMFYLSWPVLMIFPLQEGPVSQTGELKQSLDSFYVTDSPLSVTYYHSRNGNVLFKPTSL